MTAAEHIKLALEHLNAAATALNKQSVTTSSVDLPDDGYAYIEVNGTPIKVLTHARTLYNHLIAAWIDDARLQNVNQVEIAPEDFYLVQWKGTRKVAVVFPADSNHSMWRMQDFEADQHLESFLRQNNAWN